jgi:hypothetical protein
MRTHEWTEGPPAGFIADDGGLMPYWTPDGRSIGEIWAERHPETRAAAWADLTAALREKCRIDSDAPTENILAPVAANDDDIPF